MISQHLEYALCVRVSMVGGTVGLLGVQIMDVSFGMFLLACLFFV